MQAPAQSLAQAWQGPGSRGSPGLAPSEAAEWVERAGVSVAGSLEGVSRPHPSSALAPHQHVIMAFPGCMLLGAGLRELTDRGPDILGAPCGAGQPLPEGRARHAGRRLQWV